MDFPADAEWIAPQPLPRALALPAPLYVDAAAYAAEIDAVFARSWQLVGHAAEVAASGDHIVAEIGKLPVIVVRGEDGTLRAFHNVCRHRAGPLALCSGRGLRALRCRYHGWTYTLAGQLRSAPEMGDAEDFDVATIALPPLHVETWNGLVFVAIDPPVKLAELLAGIDGRLHGRALADYAFHHRVGYDIDCNWKVYIDNYLEGYHVPHIHPELNKMLDYRSYTTELSEWYSLQSSPLESAPDIYGSGEALYYFVYPNTMLNILPGRLQTNRVIPLSVSRCRVEFDYYYPQAKTPDELQRRDRDQIFSDEVQQEDLEICVQVQQRLGSGSYVAGRLCPKRESGVHHFQELLRRAYREYRRSGA